ncbi:hypothetical protein EYF80_016157 [Liparis tanakae]|uniref:Uncharacterized protein n=1 Tax=Liparis tanakae TaxID=230148 RepID=A0A4Z2I884_9TELE|nr:hypothetical protein EYF80_016157 [Liparis tanakae]
MKVTPRIGLHFGTRQADCQKHQRKTLRFSIRLNISHSAVVGVGELLQSLSSRPVEGFREQEAEAACRQAAQTEHSERQRGGVTSVSSSTCTPNGIVSSPDDRRVEFRGVDVGDVERCTDHQFSQKCKRRNAQQAACQHK